MTDSFPSFKIVLTGTTPVKVVPVTIVEYLLQFFLFLFIFEGDPFTLEVGTSSLAFVSQNLLNVKIRICYYQNFKLAHPKVYQ